MADIPVQTTPPAPPPTPPMNPQPPPPPAPKKSNTTILFALFAMFALAVGIMVFYVMNKSTNNSTPSYTPPAVTTPLLPAGGAVDQDTQIIDQSINEIDKATAEVDSGLNDQATDLTP